MSMVNRAASRSNKNVKIDSNITVTKQQTSKTENAKTAEKEKKQPTLEQLSAIIDKGKESLIQEIQEKLNKVKEITLKSEDEIVTALYDCDNNEDAAISYLLEGKSNTWSTTTKKKKSRTSSASKNDTAVNNHGENNENSEDWDKETNNNSTHQNERNNRNFRGRRGSVPRPNDRGSFNKRWRGRENKENERNLEEGGNSAGGSGRDFRGRGSDRMMNGPSRLGRGGRGVRGGGGGGRGPGGSRTFQSRDNNDRGGGGGGGTFPNQIDTWNNPETENSISKNGEFPSPEDWDNEEYTGSLADSKVFTPSTAIEIDAIESAPLMDSEIKDESLQLQMALQSPGNASIQTMVVGSNQLTAAQTQYFNQLAAQASENRKTQQTVTQVQPKSQQPQSSVIYNSSITSSQQPYAAAVTQPSFTGVTQSYASVTPSQPFTAMGSSQTFQQSPSASYQSPPSMSGSASYSRTSSEYTSSNYSDVINNYNSMQCIGLQANGSLPQRNKPQRPTSKQETPTKVMPGSVDLPAADGSMNSAMKYLDATFGALDFNSADNFDGPTGSADPNVVVSTLANKYSQNVSTNAADLQSITSFQTAQQQKQNLPSTNISTVLNQTSKLSSDSALQNDNSVYSETITNSRMASSIQDLKNSAEVSSLSYGISDAYQSQQQPSSYVQKASSNAASSFHQSAAAVPNYSSSSYVAAATPISSASANVYSGQPQQQQQQSQMSGTGVAYSTNNSFSVYSSSSHSVATATPPLHNSVYHNSTYQPHPSVTASFPSYLSYPSSIMQPYQAGAAGLTQAQYLSTQYGGGSLAGLSATYGAAPFHSNYGVSSNMQTPVATLQQSHKISSSLSTSTASKDSQYDSLQAITSAPSIASTTSGNVISGLSQTSTTASSKVTSSSTSGSKSSSMLPSIPPGVTPLLGPQYIMSQGTLPLYPPAFTLNYDDLQYLQRGMHPHMPAGYLDLNYATAPQTNLAAAAGRDALSVPFSSMSDGRFPRPDNTTSPVPPAAAGPSLSQQNTAPTHQQPHMPLLQTYATAYIYPPYQQYTTPVYQVTPTAATAAAPGSSTNAALTATQFAKAPTGYGSASYTSQYDSLGSSQGADFAGKSNSSSAYSNTQPPSKTGSGASGVSSQNANAGSTDLSMYAKSHTSLTKSYEKQAFHSGTPPPFTMPGSGSTSSNLGNVSNVSAATGYAPQLFIPSVPTAATAHGQHHLHQNAHHQDTGDMRNTGTNERNFFLSSNRSSYR